MPMHPEVASASVLKRPYADEEEKGFEYFTSTPFGSGTFSVYPRPKNRWKTGLLDVAGVQRMGIGTHLLNAFVIDVGPQRNVHGEIIHEETIDFLEKRGYEQMAIELGTLVLQDDRMMDLPAVQLLSSGGIDVRFVVIEYWKKRAIFGGPSSFRFSGVTNRLSANFEIIDQTNGEK